MKLLNIQSLRAIAALMVLCAHSNSFENHYHAHSFLHLLVPFEAQGRDLFFVISGFIMMAVHWNDFHHKQSLHFVLKRALRIYPTYWIVTLVLATIFAVMPSVVHSWVNAHANLVDSLLLIPHYGGPLLWVGGTLVCEMYFYLVFACLLTLPRRYALMGFVGWAIALGIAQLLPQSHNDVLALMQDNQTFDFLLGIAVAWFYKQQHIGNALAFLMLGIVGSAISTGLAMHFGAGFVFDSRLRFLGAGLPMAFVTYGLLALEVQKNIVLPKLIQYLGDASYSIYLWHTIVYVVLARAFTMFLSRHHVQMDILMPLIVMLVVAIGAGLYELIEKPITRALNKYYKQRFPSTRLRSSIPVVSGLVQPTHPVELRK